MRAGHARPAASERRGECSRVSPSSVPCATYLFSAFISIVPRARADALDPSAKGYGLLRLQR